VTQRQSIAEMFGSVSGCTSIEEILTFLRKVPLGDLEGRKRAAAFCMVLVAQQDARPGTSHEDALQLLNELSRTKTQIDAATSDAPDTARVTSQILVAAQDFVASVTIPCTEWPTTEEIASVVLTEAAKYAVP
jgi:hypothetical protein